MKRQEVTGGLYKDNLQVIYTVEDGLSLWESAVGGMWGEWQGKALNMRYKPRGVLVLPEEYLT